MTKAERHKLSLMRSHIDKVMGDGLDRLNLIAPYANDKGLKEVKSICDNISQEIDKLLFTVKVYKGSVIKKLKPAEKLKRVSPAERHNTSQDIRYIHKKISRKSN